MKVLQIWVCHVPTVEFIKSLNYFVCKKWQIAHFGANKAMLCQHLQYVEVSFFLSLSLYVDHSWSCDWLMRISLVIIVVLSLVRISTGVQRLDVQQYQHSVCTTGV